MVEDVEPRSSELGDPAVANVDQVMIVFSLVDPPWDGQMATRFLVCAERAQVPVCLVLNKADLAQPEQTAAIVKEVQVLPLQLLSALFDLPCHSWACAKCLTACLP